MTAAAKHRIWIRTIFSVLFLSCSSLTNSVSGIGFEQIATGLNSPLAIENAADGSGRLFIVEQSGVVRIHDGSNLLGTPFLNISSLVACCGERGLLGLAFHPRYATNRQFFVFYTIRYPEGDPRPDGDLIVARYLTSSVNPDVADPASASVILSIPHSSASNHNGGKMAFGPDGMLYIATGDGGGGGPGDPDDNAQNLGSLLGKTLRIDVDGGTPYAIPSTNPFVGQGGSRGEIWFYGFRNPWKFSFDRLNGDVFIGDVGEGQREEIDFAPSGSRGQNYGWRRMEGSRCFNPSTGCDTGTLTFPILEYDHSLGRSVTGGFRYRGLTYPQVAGLYLYGDFITGRIWGATQAQAGTWTAQELVDTGYSISSFGEDERGELYLASFGGSIVRVTFPPEFVRNDFDGDGQSDVVWRNYDTGQTHIWMMNGTQYRGSLVLPPVPAAWVIATTADFNGDGHVDIVWRNLQTAETHIWLMNRGARVGSAVLPVISLDWRPEASADFNGDGRPDLIWRNSTSGATHIWLMNGVLYGGSVVLPQVPAEWRIETTGDFNADGRLDIVWRNYTSGATHIWMMHGTVYRGSIVLPLVPLAWSIRSAADYDGDGHDDIIWRNATTSETHVWLLTRGIYRGSVVLPSVGAGWTVEGS